MHAYLETVVEVAVDVMTQSFDASGFLKDAHTEEDLVLLANREGVGVDLHAICSLESIVYVLQVAERPCQVGTSGPVQQEIVMA